MASNHTTNYNLNQWEATDKVLRTDFNEDNAKIDAALKGHADGIAALETAVAAKAAAATVTALSQTVAQKADQADLEDLESRAGNCEMELFTYTGTGSHGSGSPTEITFSVRPDLFIIGGDRTLLFGRGGVSRTILASEDFINDQTASWSGTKLSIENNISARYQMNGQGASYWVLGLKQKG